MGPMGPRGLVPWAHGPQRPGPKQKQRKGITKKNIINEDITSKDITKNIQTTPGARHAGGITRFRSPILDVQNPWNKKGLAYWASNRGCLNVFCYVFVVMSLLLCLCLLCLCSLCLFFVFVWAQAPGAHGPMVQGPWGPWGPYGPGAGAPGPKLQDTHGECNYLLSGRLPTVSRCQRCTQQPHTCTQTFPNRCT